MRHVLSATVTLLFATAVSAQNLDVRAGRLINPQNAKVLTDQRIRGIPHWCHAGQAV